VNSIRHAVDERFHLRRHRVEVVGRSPNQAVCCQNLVVKLLEVIFVDALTFLKTNLAGVAVLYV